MILKIVDELRWFNLTSNDLIVKITNTLQRVIGIESSYYKDLIL